MKHLTKSLILISLLTIMAISIIGCDQDASLQSRGSVTIQLSPDARLIGRTILPDGTTPLAISSYTIRGTGPNGEELSEVSSSTSSITLDNLLVGNWSFSATAYNSYNKALASGNVDVYIVKNQNTIDLPLDEVVGSGSLSLSFTWNTEQVTPSSTFIVSVYDDEGNEVNGATLLSDMTLGTGSVQIEVASGFYRVDAYLISEEVNIAGFSTSVRIIEETTSSASVALIIGKVINGVDITITDSTEEPIVGEITSNKETPLAGDEVLLTYSIITPSDLDEEDLTYEWYVDGNLDLSMTTHLFTVDSATPGTSRYDVVVGKEGIHSLGSATYSIVISPNPSIVNQ